MSAVEPYRVQYGALPYRRRTGGAIEVMLITSRETGRWVIPKGWPMPRLSPPESAAREAREEAGLVGKVCAEPIGRYEYLKRIDAEREVVCTVEVFALEITRQLSAWPEKAERRTRWFTPEEAAGAVQEAELAALIRRLPTILD
jgi:8-oxo-dGTP pyrophosphatase MutT (NUDIX family)